MKNHKIFWPQNSLFKNKKKAHLLVKTLLLCQSSLFSIVPLRFERNILKLLIYLWKYCVSEYLEIKQPIKDQSVPNIIKDLTIKNVSSSIVCNLQLFFFILATTFLSYLLCNCGGWIEFINIYFLIPLLKDWMHTFVTNSNVFAS